LIYSFPRPPHHYHHHHHYYYYDYYYYHQDLPTLTKLDELNEESWKDIDVVFCCLPHATTQDIIAALPKHVKVLLLLPPPPPLLLRTTTTTTTNAAADAVTMRMNVVKCH